MGGAGAARINQDAPAPLGAALHLPPYRCGQTPDRADRGIIFLTMKIVRILGKVVENLS
jgi:hypothetical protein